MVLTHEDVLVGDWNLTGGSRGSIHGLDEVTQFRVVDRVRNSLTGPDEGSIECTEAGCLCDFMDGESGDGGVMVSISSVGITPFGIGVSYSLGCGVPIF